MKLIKNVTEATTMSINADVKADMDLLAQYTNRSLDEVVNIALIEFMKQNRDHFVKNMIVEAFSELLNLEVAETCFCCPKLDVTGLLTEDCKFEIEIEVKDKYLNVIETFKENYENKEALADRLVFLFHNWIGYESEYAHQYAEERLSRPVLTTEVM